MIRQPATKSAIMVAGASIIIERKTPLFLKNNSAPRPPHLESAVKLGTGGQTPRRAIFAVYSEAPAGRPSWRREPVTTEWQIPRGAARCSVCAHEFAIGEEYQALVFDAPEGYLRQDYCDACLTEAPAAPLAAWRARRPEPATRKQRAFDREASYGFFQTLGESDELQKQQFRFVLALLLWRQKMLKLVDTTTDAQREIWQFVDPRAATNYAVVRPDLDEEEIERLSQQLEALISGEPLDETAPRDATVDGESCTNSQESAVAADEPLCSSTGVVDED